MAFPFTLQYNLTQPPLPPPPSPSLTSSSGLILDAKYIDPATGDFVLDANGNFVGMNSVDQAVEMALLTAINTTTVRGFGFGIFEIKIIGPNIQNQIKGLVNEALSQLISNGSIQLQDVVITNPYPGQIGLSVYYLNNTVPSTLTILVPQ